MKLIIERGFPSIYSVDCNSCRHIKYNDQKTRCTCHTRYNLITLGPWRSTELIMKNTLPCPDFDNKHMWQKL